MLQKLKRRKSGFVPSSSEGFTIIEVLIVLAIAGLILMIVFLAVPNLERNSRNTQRKNDVQAILGAVSEYESDNAGTLPAAGDSSTSGGSVTIAGNALTIGATGGVASATANLGYYNTGTVSVVKPTGTTYTADPSTDTVYIVEGYSCPSPASSSAMTLPAASARTVSAYYKIETSYQCTTS